MFGETTTQFVRKLALMLLLAASAGCSSKTYESYVPSDATAREALEAALTAWRDDQPYGTVRKGPPAVEMVDGIWRDGSKLTAFEILTVEAGAGPKRFPVRLSMRGSTETQQVRYVVIGQDPLWVYREEEFERLSGM